MNKTAIDSTVERQTRTTETISVPPSAEAEADALDRLILEYEQARDRGAARWPLEYILDNPKYARGLTRYFADESTLKQSVAGVGAALADGASMFGDRYLPLCHLGQGGMGSVYLAIEANVGQVVALKTINREFLQEPHARARFAVEAHAMAQLTHEHIVTLHYCDLNHDPPFLVMKCIAGPDLAQLQKSLGVSESALRLGPADNRGPASRQRTLERGDIAFVARLFAKLARALHFVHQHGLVHRDVKPNNVIVNRQGEPFLADLGLAKATGADAQSITRNQVAGTIAYLAPEVAGGQTATVISDVYGLGATLYFALAGRKPFELEAGVESPASVAILLKMVQENEPPPLSTVKELQRGAGRDLATICAACMRRDPDKRYQSAAAVADDLERLLRGDPIQARPVGFVERTVMWARTHQLQTALAATILLAVLFAIGLGGQYIFTLRAANERIAQESKKANDARDEANTAKDETIRQLYAADMLLASRSVLDGPMQRALDILDSWLPARRGGKDYRGREWHLIQRMCNTAERVLRGHDGPALALAWRPDGKLLASGGIDGVIRVWDGDSGRCVQSLAGHVGGALDVAFSPDGKRLLSGGADAIARIWDVQTGKLIHSLEGHILPVLAVAFHSDNQRAATGGADGIVKVWDAQRGSELFALQGHDGPVGKLQFDAAGRRLASMGAFPGTVLWDLQARKVVDRLTLLDSGTSFVPDLSAALARLPDGTTLFMDVPKKSADKGDHGLSRIHAVAYDNRQQMFYVAGNDDAIRLVDNVAKKTAFWHRGHVGPVKRLALRPDASRLASAGLDGTVRIWQSTVAQAFEGFHEHNITCAAFSREGSLLVTGDYLGALAVWDPRTGKRLQKLGVHYIKRANDKVAREIGTGKPVEVGVTKVRHHTVYAEPKSTLNPINHVATSVGHAGEVKSVALTPDSRLVLSAGDKTLIAWDVANGNQVKEIKHPSIVSSLDVSADGALAATGCWDNVVRLYRLPDLSLIRELNLDFEGHNGNVMCVAFTPTGRVLATGGRDRRVCLWDATTGKLLRRLTGNLNTVFALTYSPDGKYLLSGGADGSIRLWESETGRHVTTLYGHKGTVTSLAFDKNQRFFVSASDEESDARARLWVWGGEQTREAALLAHETKGPTALVLHPTADYLLLGRKTLKRFDFGDLPATEGPVETLPVMTPGIARPGLQVLGSARAAHIGAWPNAARPLKPTRADSDFLHVAVSLPFKRLEIDAANFQKLMARHEGAPRDFTAPMRMAMLIHPGRFLLLGAHGKARPAEYVGRFAQRQEHGFEYMPKGVSFLENSTETPTSDRRELISLVWETPKDFSTKGLTLGFANDPPVAVPELDLQFLRPGKLFRQGGIDVGQSEGESRLRSIVNRGKGL